MQARNQGKLALKRSKQTNLTKKARKIKEVGKQTSKRKKQWINLAGNRSKEVSKRMKQADETSKQAKKASKRSKEALKWSLQAIEARKH